MMPIFNHIIIGHLGNQIYHKTKGTRDQYTPHRVGGGSHEA